MKILHVSPSYYPAFQFGGPIQSVQLLNAALVKNGIDVEVYTTNAGLDKTQYNAGKWTDIDGVKVKYFSFFGYVHYNFSVTVLIALFRNVKHYDLVHITAVWNFTVWAACLACWWHKKLYIISPRGTIYPETIAIKSSVFKKIYYRLIAKKCLEKAACLHFTSIDEEKKVMAYLKLSAPCFVVANGISLEEFKFSPSNDSPVFSKPYLLFLGRINYKKGLDILYKAFAEFVKQHSGFQLIIAGPDTDNYKRELDKLASALDISEHIIYAGSLHSEAKVEVYKNAFCFVLPSYSENFGMSVVEAMACGCPVIISDKVGIYPEIIENKAGLVTSLDYKELAKRINDLCINNELREEIKKNGLDTVQKLYSIESVTKRFISVYQQLALHP